MTEWFERRAGELGSIEVDPPPDGPVMVMFGNDVPDWVNTPPELGPVRSLRVLGHGAAPCPKCRGTHEVRHLDLQDGLCVAECEHNCGFVWYRLTLKDEK